MTLSVPQTEPSPSPSTILPAVRTSSETEIVRIDDTLYVFYAGKRITELGKKKALADSHCFPEPGFTHGRCKMIKRDGDRCRNPVRLGWTVCRSHGAGFPGKPGGLNNEQITSGRYAKALPPRLLSSYEEFVSSPDSLSLQEELALVRTRIEERIIALGTTDVQTAWFKVRRAVSFLTGDNVYEDDVEHARTALSDALDAKSDDTAIWDELLKLIDTRRKLSETERKRKMDHQQVMTYEQANMVISYLMNSVKTHVEDIDGGAEALRAISEDMKLLDV